MSITFEWNPYVSPRQITCVAVARSLKTLCTPGVDFHPSHKNNVENKYIYLRPYRKYDCHRADFPATRTPVTTLRIHGRVAKIQPAVIRHSRTMLPFKFCAARACTNWNSHLLERPKNTSPTALPVSYQNLKNERMDSEISGGQFFGEFPHCTTF
jgi:hypothetical protein